MICKTKMKNNIIFVGQIIFVVVLGDRNRGIRFI